MQMHFNEIANIFKCLYLFRRAHTHTHTASSSFHFFHVCERSFIRFVFVYFTLLLLTT